MNEGTNNMIIKVIPPLDINRRYYEMYEYTLAKDVIK